MPANDSQRSLMHLHRNYALYLLHGPLPKSSRGNHTYLLVAIDKFSKWIKAVLVTNQEAITVVKFFESIVYRYGVPNSIITDNGTNFTAGEFQ
jgi:hypothetical protein